MPRSQRFLTTANSTMKYAAAPPPEAVTLESDFVVILAALLCAVICVVGLLAVARCAWLRRAPGGGRAGEPGSAQASSANKGLKKKVLQQLPKFIYGDGGPSAPPPKMGSECAICLGEFAEGDEIRVLPQCGHVFHVGCIDTWLGSHSSCPSCRQILVVARCHKCGNFPAISDAELKIRQDHIYHSAPAAPPPLALAAAAHSASAAATTTSCSSSSSNSNNIFLP